MLAVPEALEFIWGAPRSVEFWPRSLGWYGSGNLSRPAHRRAKKRHVVHDAGWAAHATALWALTGTGWPLIVQSRYFARINRRSFPITHGEGCFVAAEFRGIFGLVSFDLRGPLSDQRQPASGLPIGLGNLTAGNSPSLGQRRNEATRRRRYALPEAVRKADMHATAPEHRRLRGGRKLRELVPANPWLVRDKGPMRFAPSSKNTESGRLSRQSNRQKHIRRTSEGATHCPA